MDDAKRRQIKNNMLEQMPFNNSQNSPMFASYDAVVSQPDHSFNVDLTHNEVMDKSTDQFQQNLTMIDTDFGHVRQHEGM